MTDAADVLARQRERQAGDQPVHSGGTESCLLAAQAARGVNALLDVASPRIHEALLVAFLNRLARPVRGSTQE